MSIVRYLIGGRIRISQKTVAVDLFNVAFLKYKNNPNSCRLGEDDAEG